MKERERRIFDKNIPHNVSFEFRYYSSTRGECMHNSSTTAVVCMIRVRAELSRDKLQLQAATAMQMHPKFERCTSTST